MKNILKGKAMWAKVFEPDTKFNPDGDYTVDVLVPETEAAPMCEYLDGLIQERLDEEIKAYPKKKGTLSTQPPYQDNLDMDGNPTGEIKFRCKLKAKVRKKDGTTYEQKPAVFDAKRNKLSDTAIGNGSVIKVAFDPIPYVIAMSKSVGVSLRMKGVQVINLVEYGGGGADMFDDEDGYVAEAVAKDDREELFDEQNAYAEGDF